MAILQEYLAICDRFWGVFPELSHFRLVVATTYTEIRFFLMDVCRERVIFAMSKGKK